MLYTLPCNPPKRFVSACVRGSAAVRVKSAPPTSPGCSPACAFPKTPAARGASTNDDAGVYPDRRGPGVRPNGRLLHADRRDPSDFGRIAATNAIPTSTRWAERRSRVEHRRLSDRHARRRHPPPDPGRRRGGCRGGRRGDPRRPYRQGRRAQVRHGRDRERSIPAGSSPTPAPGRATTALHQTGRRRHPHHRAAPRRHPESDLAEAIAEMTRLNVARPRRDARAQRARGDRRHRFRLDRSRGGDGARLARRASRSTRRRCRFRRACSN